MMLYIINTNRKFPVYFQQKGKAILEKDLKCFLLHHNNAYLRVGPFKFELKHKSPEIALIHDFASPSEIENIKKKARGKMKSKFHQ